MFRSMRIQWKIYQKSPEFDVSVSMMGPAVKRRRRTKENQSLYAGPSRVGQHTIAFLTKREPSSQQGHVCIAKDTFVFKKNGRNVHWCQKDKQTAVRKENVGEHSDNTSSSGDPVVRSSAKRWPIVIIRYLILQWSSLRGFFSTKFSVLLSDEFALCCSKAFNKNAAETCVELRIMPSICPGLIPVRGVLLVVRCNAYAHRYIKESFASATLKRAHSSFD
jgi:hypothetical protein